MSVDDSRVIEMIDALRNAGFVHSAVLMQAEAGVSVPEPVEGSSLPPELAKLHEQAADVLYELYLERGEWRAQQKGAG